MTDFSSVLCALAALVGVGCVLRSRPRHASLLTSLGALTLLALWALSISLYARHPQAAAVVRVTLTALCIVATPWLALALSLGDPDFVTTLSRWRGLLAAQAVVSALAGLTMWGFGVDWITGIGAEPTAVLSSTGSVALAAGLLPALMALALFAVRLPNDVSTMPALVVGIVGVMGGVLWIGVGLLGRGYLSLSPLASPVAVAGVAASVWAAGLVREFATTRSLAPSRRLVYGAVALSLVLAYLLAARVAMNWVAVMARGAIPVLLPVMAFLLAAGLLIGLGSRRVRHRLWVTIGQQLFRSKHDYGEVWIHLTESVSAARDTTDFLQRAALFCRDVLYVPETSIWLVEQSGRLSRVAHAAPAGSPSAPERGVRAPSSSGSAVPSVLAEQDPAIFAHAVGASAAFPMQLSGQCLGFIAVGGQRQDIGLDEEDRRVMRYIAAQVASAVALYRLGEEIADAREVASFHRLSAFVIHDLKNLVAQQSFVLENATKFGSNPAFVVDALAAFEDSTNRMRGLIARLRSREPGGPPATTPCDLGDLIRELICMPRLAQRSGCAVHLELPDGAGTCMVRADRTALAQVFRNLLVNAVESLAPDAGEVTVRVTRVEAGWQVTVQDNGCGMAEAYLREDLFRPFRTTKDGGLGIGMYQCRAVVEAAGGTIAVRSREHTGTIVAVTLPAWLPSPPNGNGKEEGARHGKAHSVGR